MNEYRVMLDAGGYWVVLFQDEWGNVNQVGIGLPTLEETIRQASLILGQRLMFKLVAEE